MINHTNIDIKLEKHNGKFFDEFLSKLQNISTEEDLRIALSSLINKISSILNIKIPEEKHEYTVLHGRIDSLYGEVIIEYKAPKMLSSFNSSAKNMQYINQVKNYILDIEKKHKKASNRYLGIILDGYKIIFIRRRNKLWDIESPIDLDKDSFSLLLKRIFSIGLTGKALIIDNLLNDFSIISKEVVSGISTFYYNFTKNNKGKINLLYEQWKILFREICGYDFNTKKREMKELIKTLGLPTNEQDLGKIIFSIQTYYAIFIKLLGAETLTYFRHRNKSYISSLSISKNELKNEIEKMENGILFKLEGINNYIEADFFNWYLLSWDKHLYKAIFSLIDKFKGYDFSSLNLEPKEAKDLIKNIYHYLLPKNLRHSLGEYYTPDWLAEFLIQKLNINFKSIPRILDPTCGSGTFINLMIENIIKNNVLPKKQLLKKILDSIIGVDLNPLAVISAKTNYIIALSDFLQDIDESGIDIPIFLSDSMLAPLEYKEKAGDYYTIPTKAGVFKLPSKVIKSNKLSMVLDLLSSCVDNDIQTSIFLNKLGALKIGFTSSEEDTIKCFYEQLAKLQKEHLNGIWGKIIKNVFAPAFFDKFDYLIGNPPWINWQNLPEDYRDSIKKYWEDYKVFSHTGLKARLGSAHDDICVLLTYIVIDKFLKDDGLLGFVLPQNLFQSIGGGDGFRRFQIKDNKYISVEEVHDFVKVRPFADMGTANKPSTCIIKKNKKIKYPVKYFKWIKKERRTIPSDQRLSAVIPLLQNDEESAEPIKDNIPTSSWLIANAKRLKALKKLVGHSNYKARKGVDTSLNGLYWGKINSTTKNNIVLFRNEPSTSKKQIKQYEVPIEKELVFPMLRGKDIAKWKASSKLFSIIPYKKNGKCISEKELKKTFPFCHKFFYKTDPKISTLLEQRGIYQKHLKAAKIPKHGLYDIGAYTFCKHKVVWKALSNGMIASVISTENSPICGNKIVIPDHNILVVPLDNKDEAHYLCGILNSEIVSEFVKAYISWFYSSHILEHIAIPDFDKTNKIHIKIVELSKMGHKKGILTNNEAETLNNLVISGLK